MKSVEIGYVLNPNFRRKGYMKEAINILIDYMIKINIELITAKVYIKKQAPIKLLENFGFEKDGEFDKSFRYPGRNAESMYCYF